MNYSFTLYLLILALCLGCSSKKNLEVQEGPSEARIALDSSLFYVNKKKDYETARVWLIKTDSLASKSNDKIIMSHVLGNYGWIFSVNYEYDSALFYYEKSLEIAQEAKNISIQIDRYIRIARIYRFRSQFSKSVGILEKSLSLAKEINDEPNIAQISNTLGNILSDIGESEKSMEYYRVAIGIWSNEIPMNKDYPVSLHNMATTLVDMDSVQEALPILYKALELKNSMGRESSKAYTLSALGTAYRKLDSLEKSRDMFLRAFEIRQRLNQKAGLGQIYYRLAQVDIGRGIYTIAAQSLDEAEVIAQETGNPKLLRDVYRIRKDLYKTTSRYKDWMETDEIFDVLTDSIQREEKLKVQEVQSTAELQREQQRTTLAEQGAQLARFEADSERQKGELRLYLGLVALLGVMLAGWQLWQIRKRNAVLVTLNSRIRLITDNAFHSQKNALGLISALLRSKARQSEHDKELEVLRDVEGKIEALGGVAKYLFQTRLNDNAEVAASIQLATYLKSLIQDTFSSVASDMAKLEMKLEDISVSSTEALNIGLIANEAVTNFSKYAETFGGDQLEIETKHRDGELFFQMRDNGPGFPKDFNISTSTGFGMQMMSNLVDDMGGVLSMLRQDGWTMIQISIPLKT